MIERVVREFERAEAERKQAEAEATRAGEQTRYEFEAALSRWLQAFLGTNDFAIVGERLAMTGDGLLLYVRHDSFQHTLRGTIPDAFVLVAGRCGECQKLVRDNRRCRSLAQIGAVLMSGIGDWTHVCGAVSSPHGLLSYVSIYPECVDRVFESVYGISIPEMGRDHLFTRRGPVRFGETGNPSQVHDPLARYGLTAEDLRNKKAQETTACADSPFSAGAESAAAPASSKRAEGNGPASTSSLLVAGAVPDSAPAGV